MLNIEYKRDKIFLNKKLIFDDLLSGNYKVYILGMTNYSRIIADFLQSKSIEISGFIDDYTSETEFCAKKIFKVSQSNRDAIIISGVVEGRPKTAYNMLRREGFEKIIDYFDFNYLYPELFKIPYNNDNYHKILNNVRELEKIYEIIEEESSKIIFNEVIDFRLNFNYLEQNFIYQPEKQYFENLFDFDSIETFVDCGGYDGETTLSAINNFRNLQKVFYIEPYPKIMLESKKRLSKINTCKIIYLETALSSGKLFSRMTEEKGNANHLSEEGNIIVKVSDLSSLINEKVSYLKLDIEGEEYNALLGSERIIKKYKPSIAVCVYHYQDHFWQIPKYLLELVPSYKIYLRHYTEGVCETVMYFI